MTQRTVFQFDQDNLQHCCGVNEVGGFCLQNTERDWLYSTNLDRSGTGLLIATFNDAQKAEYEAFSKLVKILYQSPPKRNRGGNRVFVVVAQNKPERKPRNKLPKL